MSATCILLNLRTRDPLEHVQLVRSSLYEGAIVRDFIWS